MNHEHMPRHMLNANTQNKSTRRVSLFRNGKNQAIRIPRDFEMQASEAKLTKDGDRLILEPIMDVPALLDVLSSLPQIKVEFPDVDVGLPELDEVEI